MGIGDLNKVEVDLIDTFWNGREGETSHTINGLISA
jgi:hypothetical protein